MINISDPTSLLDDYEKLYARVIETLAPPGSQLDVFFIGGGGYIFPRWIEAKYRGQITVAEIDPEVTRVARDQLGLNPSARMMITSDDARRVLRSLSPSMMFDAVFGDAFNDFQVPYHLTTSEFHVLVASHLKPNGVYLLNVVDGVYYDFLRSELRTLRVTFPYVAVLTPTGQWLPQSGHSTFVIVAAKTAPQRPLPVISAQALDEFVARERSVVLTDDYAPVDQLLAPVFSQQLHARPPGLPGRGQELKPQG